MKSMKLDYEFPSASGKSVAAEMALAKANATATPPVAFFEIFATAGIIRAATNGKTQIAHTLRELEDKSKGKIAISKPPLLLS